MNFEPKLDLTFERRTHLPIEQLWTGWTDPATLMKWFCPKPWRVTECRIDLKPGGEFFTVMEGPNGEKMPNSGCYLEVIPNQKLIWTNLMSVGFRPAMIDDPSGFPFVAIITLSKDGDETVYTATVKHGSEDARRRHEQMGFQEGWGAAFNQLVSLSR